MRVPREISTALRRRTKYAVELSVQDDIVSQFILDNHLDADIEDYDYLSGCEMYVNPYASEQRVRRAIENHKDGGE